MILTIKGTVLSQNLDRSTTLTKTNAEAEQTFCKKCSAEYKFNI